jgi:hypothetical protein
MDSAQLAAAQCGVLAHKFLEARTLIKLFHWQTRSYAKHKATCGLLEKLDPLIDSFIEVAIPQLERPRFMGATMAIPMMNFQDADGDAKFVSYLRAMIQFLLSDVNAYIPAVALDLKTIRDQMIQEINQTLYLFTLN